MSSLKRTGMNKHRLAQTPKRFTEIKWKFFHYLRLVSLLFNYKIHVGDYYLTQRIPRSKHLKYKYTSSQQLIKN